MRLVNDFIRTQVHIDVAREMEATNGILPSKLAVDGLHLDIEGKKKIAAAVNANWARITGLPWQKAIVFYRGLAYTNGRESREFPAFRIH